MKLGNLMTMVAQIFNEDTRRFAQRQKQVLD